VRALELRRHSLREPDADALSEEGRVLALHVGKDLPGGYAAIYTSPAKRAAETVAWLLRGLGQQLPQDHGVSEGLGSPVEDRWRSAAKAASTGRIDAIREHDAELVDQESRRLGSAARDLLASLPGDGRALAVGHSPLIEAAVFDITQRVIEPLRECEGVLLEQDDDGQIGLASEYRRS
jgi:broad specificity phosphatase PhoE